LTDDPPQPWRRRVVFLEVPRASPVGAPWELTMRKYTVLPRGRKARNRTRGVSKVDMELNEASHGGVQELSVDYDINSTADYNFWRAQDG
jgi:hypothetical protein